MGASLIKLRRAFLLVGAALLAALGVLLHSALSTLDEQRGLRHQMVAERVFDEVERELSTLLAHESARPSTAYDAHDTDPHRWSPFIVGYYVFTSDITVLAEPQLDADRGRRVRAAVLAAHAAMSTEPTRPLEARTTEVDRELLAPLRRPSSPEVLRQLNRGVRVRDRLRRSSTFQIVQAAPQLFVSERMSPSEERREGFVIDVPALISMIQSWVLTAQGLDDVASLSLNGPAKGAEAGSYRFKHALAAPFDSQVLSLRLSRLDDEDASALLYGLAALLSAAVVLGLLALYHMAAVQVRFAERRDNFVAAVTHELKTPLTAIRMYGEMLRDGMVQDEQTRKEYYAMITAEGERLTRLINNVLEHARLRQGERPMRLVLGDLGALVREVIEVMRPHIEREGFAIELAIEAALPRARFDEDALKQVLFNVLDNALKYGRSTAERGGALRIGCSAAGEGVVLSVRDFGPGVPAANLPAIFDPFYRAQDELTRRQKGTGIGLSLVRDLVEGMQGKVTGENRFPGLEVRVALRS